MIRGARHLLTLRGFKAPRHGSALGNLGVIQGGAILIRDGILAEVGPTRGVENLAEARDAIDVDASGRVVLPGFVDSHTHLALPTPGSSDADRAAGAVRGLTAHRIHARLQGYLKATPPPHKRDPLDVLPTTVLS